MILRRAIIAIVLVAAVAVSLNRSRSDTLDEPRLITPWYWGTISFDSDYGRETVQALLYVEQVRPRGYFMGAMWYPEANEILDVIGRLASGGQLRWFSVVSASYAVDPPLTPRGERMFFYKNLGYDYGVHRAIGGVVTKATWDLQPILVE